MEKKFKNNIKIYQPKVGVEERQELLDEIKNNGTFLPQSIMHEDLDKGMLEFVSKELEIVNGESVVPVNKIMFTVQRWSEYAETWFNSDEEGNVQLPFITVIRKPDPQPGSHPALQYTIPHKRTYTYATVPTWDGNQYGQNIYKIAQPVPIDISYDVIIVCDKTRTLNKFNKVVLQKFSSRQAYTNVKGHYIPIILDSITDESPFDNLEGRRYYQQVYNFRMEGFLIDEKDFEVKPAINRIIVSTELQKEPTYRSVTYKKNTEVVTKTFTGDGNKTLFTTGEKIGLLIGVAVNGLSQKLTINYNHHNGTSNIIFNTPPGVGQKVIVIYITQRVLRVNQDNKDFEYESLDLTYVDNPEFQITPNVEIVYLTVNNLIVTDYTYDNDTGILEMTGVLSSGDEINLHLLK